MSTLMSRIFSAALLVGQGACIAIAIPIEQSSDPDRRGQRGVGQGFTITDSPAFGSKAVVGKRPPNLLIAPDGSECIVSRAKYAQVALGNPMICIWGDAIQLELVPRPTRH